MKKLSRIVLSLVAVAGLWSCEGEDNFMFTEPKAASFAILTPDSGSSVILTEAAPQANTAFTFTWEDMEYTTPTAVTYTVQIAKNGTDFAEPVTVASSSLRNYSISVGALNDLVHSIYGEELVAPEEGEAPTSVALDVRIVSSVGTTGSEEAYSNVISVVVTPFFTSVVEVKELYLVGTAVASGYNNNANNIALFRDPANTNIYYYNGYFGAGEFKLLEKKGFWQPQWGQTGGDLAVNDGTGSDPGAFPVSAAGYYSFTIDIDEMTYSLEDYSGPVEPTTTYDTIGIIGTATPGLWDSSTAMTVDPLNPHIWQLTIELVTGELKFRANNAWDMAWGNNTPISGEGSSAGGSPNVPVTAGEYTIYFNDLDGRYILIPN